MKTRLEDSYVSTLEYVKEWTEPEKIAGVLMIAGVLGIIAACMLTFSAPLYWTQFAAFSAVIFVAAAGLMVIGYCAAYKIIERYYS